VASRTQLAVSTPAFTSVQAVGCPEVENRLIHGDNLRALEWLRHEFEGRFRCVYLDPPFNTGRRFAEYDDARTPDQWRGFMRDRLIAIAPLLAPDGAVFLEIDDSELGPAITLCDEVFGRTSRVSTITVVRSAATGHKAKNRGPTNVSDFILVYEKTKGAWRPFPQRRERRGYDNAYGTFLVNPEAPHRAWRFESLALAVARHSGHATALAARRALGKTAFETATFSFALAHKGQVVRFAQPRYEAVSHAAQRAIDASRRSKGRVVRLVRPGHPDLILRDGNRILFLASKVSETKDGPRLVEPLTNVWDDIPFQGIAREGGVVFLRNKKPERLIERVLSLATDRGDWVLDPFVGSGTTAAVAEKMGRRWVGVDEADVLWSLAIPRMTRVVNGEDVGGVTRAHGYLGGGGFTVYA
jgi:adenine-specific DNA-methyltransferase